MAKVLLKKVEKQYPNGFKAVHGIDLDINLNKEKLLVQGGYSETRWMKMDL